MYQKPDRRLRQPLLLTLGRRSALSQEPGRPRKKDTSMQGQIHDSILATFLTLTWICKDSWGSNTASRDPCMTNKSSDPVSNRPRPGLAQLVRSYGSGALHSSAASPLVSLTKHPCSPPKYGRNTLVKSNLFSGTCLVPNRLSHWFHLPVLFLYRTGSRRSRV